MSKILRRPMFRGGPVDSRGTGITSGLYAEGGAVETPKRGIVDGPGSYSYRNFTTGGELLNLDNSMGQGGQFDILNMKDFLGTSRNILDQQKDVEVGSDGDTIKKTVEDIFTEEKVKKDADEAKAKEMGVDVETMKAIEKENLSTSGVSDAIKEKNILTQKDLSTSNEPSSTVIDEKALIREQAELFKELLGEQNEKKLKDARISDASDYLLKFFEGSQKEGATVGSSAADVAGFATSKDSKTERAKAQIEKGNQTATALAINDYIAGKRSKEQVQSMIAGLKLKSEFAKGSLGQNIMAAAAKAGGTITVGGIETIVRGMNQGAEVVRITEQQVKDGYEVSGADNGKFLIEEGTKNVFEVINGNKVRRY
jgi:hypothetical protein